MLPVNKPGLTQFLPCRRKSFRKAAAHLAFSSMAALTSQAQKDLNSFSASNRSLPIPSVTPHDPEAKDKHANHVFQEGQAGKKDSSVPR